LPKRTFKSFKQATAEASISSFTEEFTTEQLLNGVVQGNTIGDYIINKLKMIKNNDSQKENHNNLCAFYPYFNLLLVKADCVFRSK
jgi:hypothetical protein